MDKRINAGGDGAEPSLDPSAIAKLRELDPDGRHGVVPRVLQTYEKSLQKQLDDARAALDRGDVAALAAIAHLLKSSSASVGALALSACCASLEADVRKGMTGDVVGRVENLLTEGERALRAVRAMLRT